MKIKWCFYFRTFRKYSGFENSKKGKSFNQGIPRCLWNRSRFIFSFERVATSVPWSLSLENNVEYCDCWDVGILQRKIIHRLERLMAYYLWQTIILFLSASTKRDNTYIHMIVTYDIWASKVVLYVWTSSSIQHFLDTSNLLLICIHCKFIFVSDSIFSIKVRNYFDLGFKCIGCFKKHLQSLITLSLDCTYETHWVSLTLANNDFELKINLKSISKRFPIP